jgi:hypothetical protein
MQGPAFHQDAPPATIFNLRRFRFFGSGWSPTQLRSPGQCRDAPTATHESGFWFGFREKAFIIPSGMDEVETKSRSSGIMWATAPFIFLLLYVLSVGPVGYGCKNYPSTYPVLRSFYYPLILLHENTVLRKPLEAYLNLWGVH